jgi:hypothetical protein
MEALVQGMDSLPLNEIPPNAVYDTTSLVADYQGMRSFSPQDIDEYFADEEEKPALWPERVLILCDWGCNIYSCLDCSASDLPIFRMDSNENFMVEWAIEASSLQSWLETCVDGTFTHLDWDQAKKVSVSLLRRTS